MLNTWLHRTESDRDCSLNTFKQFSLPYRNNWNYINYLYPLPEVFSRKAVSIDYALGGVPLHTEIFYTYITKASLQWKRWKMVPVSYRSRTFHEEQSCNKCFIATIYAPFIKRNELLNAAFLLTYLYFVNSNTPDPLKKHPHSHPLGCRKKILFYHS